jgi:predicted ATP-grasp superfamily ATP-dependent carboligase
VTTGQALLMGDRNIAVALRATGADVVVVGGRTVAARFSRFADDWLDDPRPDEDALVARLLERARSCPGPSVLFYQFDDALLFISRRRDELGKELLFALPSVELVEQLVDKAAFQRLAARMHLPVPEARVVELPVATDAMSGLELPILIKPLRRDPAWTAASPAKAAVAHDRDELARLLDHLAHSHQRVIAQTLVPGPESAIESYHVHVDRSGRVAAEFTGRKVRTHPAAMGHSTALVTTDAPDVVRLGRELVERMELRGVAKLDFKRAPDGRLWLLEVNPRFNLWHHVGAAAGVNIPLSVWRDQLGMRPGPTTTARAGVTWCALEKDARAAREAGMSLRSWLVWAARANTRSTIDPIDPLPFLAGTAAAARERLGGLRRRRRGGDPVAG